MGHPLIAAFKQTTPDGTVTKNPLDLPGSTFAQVIIDLLTPDQANGDEPTFAEVVDDVLPATSSDLRKALLSLYKLSDFDVGRLTTSIEVWFDAQMDRITGAYKRWAKRWVIAVAAVVVIVGGIDSIAIGRTLYVHETVRAAVVQAAEGDALCPRVRPRTRVPRRRNPWFRLRVCLGDSGGRWMLSVRAGRKPG